MASTLSFVTTSTPRRLDARWPSPSTTRVSVTGEVDLATAHLLRERLLGALRGQATAVLGVDLAGVTFLDCTGIGALVAVNNAATRAGRQVWVTHPRPIVRRVLDLTGLLGMLTVPIRPPSPVNGFEHASRNAPVAGADPPACRPPPDNLGDPPVRPGPRVRP